MEAFLSQEFGGVRKTFKERRAERETEEQKETDDSGRDPE